MPFVKGQKKHPNSGIKKGQKHQNWRRSLEDLLKKHNINLLEDVLLDIPHMHPDKRNGVRLAVWEYLMPKLKSVEMSGLPENVPSTNVHLSITPSKEEKAAIVKMLEDPKSLAALRVVSDAMALPAAKKGDDEEK